MFFGHNLSAQDEKCGMEAHMHEMMQDPEFARQWEIDQAKFRNAVAQSINYRQNRGAMDPIVVPVAVHFPGGVESDRACLEALAQNQVDIVNLDFSKTISDSIPDSSANNLYGTVYGGASLVSDNVRGNVLQFDGINDYVQIPSNPNSLNSFLGTSMYFDGVGDYIKAVTIKELPLDNSPRTISAWI